MAYIDIDLDEFSSSDIVSEVQHRMESKWSKFSGKEIMQLRMIVGVSSDSMDINSLADKLKFEHLCKVFEKYSINEMQERLPE